jgi:hypothetical protein
MVWVLIVCIQILSVLIDMVYSRVGLGRPVIDREQAPGRQGAVESDLKNRPPLRVAS